MLIEKCIKVFHNIYLGTSSGACVVVVVVVIVGCPDESSSNPGPPLDTSFNNKTVIKNRK